MAASKAPVSEPGRIPSREVVGESEKFFAPGDRLPSLLLPSVERWERPRAASFSPSRFQPGRLSCRDLS